MHLSAWLEWGDGVQQLIGRRILQVSFNNMWVTYTELDRFAQDETELMNRVRSISVM